MGLEPIKKEQQSNGDPLIHFGIIFQPQTHTDDHGQIIYPIPFSSFREAMILF
jgi:hypothetical protein